MADYVGPIVQSPIGPRGDEIRGGRPETTPEGTSFQDVLKKQIMRVNGMQQDADRAIEDLETGKTDNVGEVMVAIEKADLAFKALMQIRNKLLDAYNEISRMRV